MDWKTKLKAAVVSGAALLSNTVSAAYTPTYTTTDAAPSFIDFMVTIIVGMVGEADTMGVFIALSISLSLMVGLIMLLFKAINYLKKQGK